MLILQRQPGQPIWIGNDIKIILIGHSKGLSQIGVNAPHGINIVRGENKGLKRYLGSSPFI